MGNEMKRDYYGPTKEIPDRPNAGRILFLKNRLYQVQPDGSLKEITNNEIQLIDNDGEIDDQ